MRKILGFLKVSMRPIWGSFVKVWNLTIGDFSLFRILLSYFQKAFFTNNHTIFCFPASALLYGNTNNWAFNFSKERFPAFRTPEPLIIPSTLSLFSLDNNLGCKNHESPPSLSEWREGRADDYLYYLNDKWTGMAINRITYLWIEPARLPCIPYKDKILTLKHPSFRITQSSNNSTISIVEAPTLKKAKQLAEWYYKEWVKSTTIELNPGDLRVQIAWLSAGFRGLRCMLALPGGL